VNSLPLADENTTINLRITDNTYRYLNKCLGVIIEHSANHTTKGVETGPENENVSDPIGYGHTNVLADPESGSRQAKLYPSKNVKN
jgi:hypothetical protein